MTTVLKLLPPLYIHPILWFFLLISVLTGTFMEICIIFIIVLIHELGHFTVANYYKWRIRKINLWVFGGVMETDEHASKPMKQELFITLAGPLQHVWIHGVLVLLSSYSILPPSITTMGYQYNATILLFNLLPIWPLDGGKLLLLFFSSLFPYRKAHSMMVVCSITFLIAGLLFFLFFYPFTLSTILLGCFILWENRLEWKRRYYSFMRFLLKRYTDPTEQKRTRAIVVRPDEQLMNVFSQFSRNYYHHVYVKEPYQFYSNLMDEKDCLHTYFRLKQHQTTAGEVASFKD